MIQIPVIISAFANLDNESLSVDDVKKVITIN